MQLRQWAARFVLGALVAGLAFSIVGLRSDRVKASDHDDGETNIKSRNASLTDLFVFREDWYTGVANDANNLIFIMGTNPRSLPRQHYYFNTNALYNFHVTRNANNNDAVSGREDLRFEFSFGAPDANNQQAIRFNVHNIANGVPTNTTLGVATNPVTTAARPLLAGTNTPVVNTFNVNGTNIDVFAGLREDPFFFDVEAYFRLRASLRGSNSPTDVDPIGFAPNTAQSVDFAQGYNINAIVMRVPIAFLQANGETSFDAWETITMPGNITVYQ